MVERIDYRIGKDWDIHFTDWDDFEVARDEDVLTQNFLLIASTHTSELLGGQFTTTDLARHRRRLESEFRSRESVSYFSIQNVDVSEDTIWYTLIIGSDEYTVPLRL